MSDGEWNVAACGVAYAFGGQVAADEGVSVSDQVSHVGDGVAVDDVPAASNQVFDHGIDARAVGVVRVDFQNHLADGVHEIQVYSNTASESVNHTPVVAVGLAIIPVPMTVPAVIIALSNSDGVFLGIFCHSARISERPLCRTLSGFVRHLCRSACKGFVTALCSVV